MNVIMVTLGGGLGNRMLGLASARVLAAREKAKLFVYWPVGHSGTGCPEGFTSDLFSLFAIREEISKATHDQLRGEPHISSAHYSLERQQAEPVRLADFTTIYTHGIIRNAGIQRADVAKQLARLIPSSVVTARYSQAKQITGENYTGLLVRCHGHPQARKWNPRRKFEALMPTLKGVSYICCDDPDVASSLLRRSTGQPYMIGKAGRRNTVDELITVVAEIYLLSEATVCYATPHCAMTEVVAMLRKDGVCRTPKIAPSTGTVLH